MFQTPTPSILLTVFFPCWILISLIRCSLSTINRLPGHATLHIYKRIAHELASPFVSELVCAGYGWSTQVTLIDQQPTSLTFRDRSRWHVELLGEDQAYLSTLHLTYINLSTVGTHLLPRSNRDGISPLLTSCPAPLHCTPVIIQLIRRLLFDGLATER